MKIFVFQLFNDIEIFHKIGFCAKKQLYYQFPLPQKGLQALFCTQNRDYFLDLDFAICNTWGPVSKLVSVGFSIKHVCMYQSLPKRVVEQTLGVTYPLSSNRQLGMYQKFNKAINILVLSREINHLQHFSQNNVKITLQSS